MLIMYNNLEICMTCVFQQRLGGENMVLPRSDGLSIQSLSRVFSDMSESYKIFWFSGVFDVIKAGRDCATYDEIINHMITDAWYMVSEYHLNLGPSDTLEKLVLYTQGVSGLKPSSKAQDILGYLSNSTDPVLARYKSILSLNVPYRFQAPFMPDFRGSEWSKASNVIARVNRDDKMIYRFGPGTGLSRTIHINDIWQAYFCVNQAIVTGWLEYNLITYLQKRNPSVPGISNKLFPPSERKMEKAKKFWKGVIEFRPIQNIYAPDNCQMSADDVSLDHFIPWSYVTHDELWNLVPTTRGLNSSKSNSLPNWDRFFPLLCEIEYSSYQSVWASDQIHSLFEKCQAEHVNSNEALIKLYVPNLNKIEYTEHLEELILPTYNAAKNLGFGEWAV